MRDTKNNDTKQLDIAWIIIGGVCAILTLLVAAIALRINVALLILSTFAGVALYIIFGSFFVIAAVLLYATVLNLSYKIAWGGMKNRIWREDL